MFVVCVHVHIYVHACGGHLLTWGLLPALSLCLLRRRLLLSPLCLLGAGIAGGQWEPPGLSVCAGDLNSGSHVFIASASSTELSPCPQTAWTLKWRSPSFRWAIHLVSLRFLDTEAHIVLADCWKTAPGRRTLLRFSLLGHSCLLPGWHPFHSLLNQCLLGKCAVWIVPDWRSGEMNWRGVCFKVNEDQTRNLQRSFGESPFSSLSEVEA